MRQYCCILSKFYIKPQQNISFRSIQQRCILSKFYIKPQLSGRISLSTCGCILSKFYIKPQLEYKLNLIKESCILSKFYIKPQLFIDTSPSPICCILSKFYIKPQQKYNESIKHWRCILSKFYIKPQQKYNESIKHWRCILSKFYIKPQLVRGSIRRSSVVSYRNSTSNHNLEYKTKNEKTLYLIEILHQTTTFPAAFRKSPSCILSKFYIKPQLCRQRSNFCCVVSYRNSTSNHNFVGSVRIFVVLYLIEILHQTTTGVLTSLCDLKLYLIEILHQTTTFPLIVCTTMRCILSKFYIKPQPFRRSR